LYDVSNFEGASQRILGIMDLSYQFVEDCFLKGILFLIVGLIDEIRGESCFWSYGGIGGPLEVSSFLRKTLEISGILLRKTLD
jgi:formate hydrogenlyase subunit 3/multisubunit Na+/H+ antiporter MnhD subunit